MTQRIRDVTALTLVLSACAGPPAGGQIGPTAGEPAIRPNLYEVPVDVTTQSQEPAFIEVSGTGSVSVAPDRATVSFAMETRAASAAAAASQNADAMDAVLRAVRGGSFPDLVVETFGYSLRPEYSTNANQRSREIVAYTASNNVSATTSDVNAVGRIIDVAIGAGANRVANIGFRASDTDQAASEALAMAVENARSQAEVIATSLGYELGPPLEVHGGAQRPGPVPMMMDAVRSMEFQAAPTPIEAGEQTVTASVTIRFGLGRGRGD